MLINISIQMRSRSGYAINTDVYYNDYITVDTVLKKGSCKESEFAKFVLKKSDVIITKDSETPVILAFQPMSKTIWTVLFVAII